MVEPSINALQIVFPSGIGDARLMINVGDTGGVVALLMEQLECLLGTDIISILNSIFVLHYSSSVYLYSLYFTS